VGSHRAIALTALLVAVLALLLAASGLAQPPPTEKDLIGRYACTFTQGDTAYPPFRCEISKRKAGLWLEKLTGSQRIKGEVALTEAGFRFTGTFYCPLGDCTRPVNGDFRRTGPGRYQGQLDDGPEPTVVRLDRK
jgi:hypothetical protein